MPCTRFQSRNPHKSDKASHTIHKRNRRREEEASGKPSAPTGEPAGARRDEEANFIGFKSGG